MLDARSKPDATPPLPGWITPDLIADTRAVFEPLYRRSLSDAEVVELLLNVGRLFAALAKTSRRAASHQGRFNRDIANAAPESLRRASHTK